jgi:hypothetical protein
MEKNNLGDPKVFGPGCWFMLHLQATDATTPEKIANFISTLNLVIENLKCAECRSHAMEYLKTHPIEPFINLRNDSGRLIGMAKYVWKFHNTVNIRLGKSEVDWETAFLMYSTFAGTCTKDCGADQSLLPLSSKSSLHVPPLSSSLNIKTRHPAVRMNHPQDKILLRK